LLNSRCDPRLNWALLSTFSSSTCWIPSTRHGRLLRLKGRSMSLHLKSSRPPSSIIAIIANIASIFFYTLHESLPAPWTLQPFLCQTFLQLQSRQSPTPFEVCETSSIHLQVTRCGCLTKHTGVVVSWSDASGSTSDLHTFTLSLHCLAWHRWSRPPPQSLQPE